MSFVQTPPALGNQLDDDAIVTGLLTRALGPAWERAAPLLREMGEIAGHELYALQLADRESLPALTQWDPWGSRVDHITLTPLWRRAQEIAATMGVVATAYEDDFGEDARLVQMALTYLFHASSDVYTCPLAMTDGAARTLLTHQNAALSERALPRLLSRDPRTMWTSGQWMTERTGGSDVGLSETRAEPVGDGTYRLHGVKWFTSATTSEMALTLARPAGNPAGGRGLALFYLEPRLGDGRPNNLTVNRLKDKLGTRKVPTAEITLDGALATPVAGLLGGVRAISPMLNVTRTWNAVAAASDTRRAVALALDYARRRSQFGALLWEKPLHQETLADLVAEHAGIVHLAFFAAETLGRVERGGTDRDALLLRMATPIAKATTARYAVDVVTEAIEAFGGAGYIEDTGLPRILRDVHVTPIWEGTTNVLSLELLRGMGDTGDGLRVVAEEIVRRTKTAPPALADEACLARAGVEAAMTWATGTTARGGRPALEAGARGLLLTLGRALSLGLLIEQATWAAAKGDSRPTAIARRYASLGVDRLNRRPAAADVLA